MYKQYLEEWVDRATPESREWLINYYLETNAARHVARKLWHKYKSKIESCVHIIDLDDLVVVAEESIIRAVDTYDPSKGCSLNSWVSRTMYAVTYDEIRRNVEGGVRNGLFDSSLRIHRAYSHIEGASHEDFVEDGFDMMERLGTNALHEAISNLPDAMRQAITLVDLMGMSFREASRAFSDERCTATRVHTLRKKALKILHTCLEPQLSMSPSG